MVLWENFRETEMTFSNSVNAIGPCAPPPKKKGEKKLLPRIVHHSEIKIPEACEGFKGYVTGTER